LATGGGAEVAADGEKALLGRNRGGLAKRDGLIGGGTVGGVMDGHTHAKAGKRKSDATTEAATGTGDKNDSLGIHEHHSIRRKENA
jgi:hypothetical protein